MPWWLVAPAGGRRTRHGGAPPPRGAGGARSPQRLLAAPAFSPRGRSAQGDPGAATARRDGFPPGRGSGEVLTEPGGEFLFLFHHVERGETESRFLKAGLHHQERQ